MVESTLIIFATRASLMRRLEIQTSLMTPLKMAQPIPLKRQLSRILLQYSLSTYYDVDQLPEIMITKQGKPVFRDAAYPNFNLSHSHEYYVVILSQNSIVGIDIERITQRNVLALARRICQLSEQEWLLQQDDLIPAFYQIWSAKEAYLKATGEGLVGLKQVQLLLEQHKIRGKLAFPSRLFIGDTLSLDQTGDYYSFAYIADHLATYVQLDFHIPFFCLDTLKCHTFECIA